MGGLRQALIEAAVETIADGVDALSLRELAARAGVSPGAPLSSLPQPQRLDERRIAEEGFTRLEAQLIAARDTGRRMTPARALRRWAWPM